MLHQQAGVDGDEDAGAEPAQQAHERAHALLAVFEGVGGVAGAEGAGAGFADGGDDARGGVEDGQAVEEANDYGGGDGFDGGVHEAEGRVQDIGETAQGLQEGCVARHEDWGKRGEVAFVDDVGFLACAGFVGVGGLVVGEDLVDAEGDVGEEEAAFDDVAAA